MAKKNNKITKPERLNITFTVEQTRQLNTYIIKVGSEQGRIPSGIKTKILRAAFDGWIKHHENEFDIDWTTKD